MKDIKFKFEDLKVYQKGLDFVNLVYKVCNNFPKTERYALSSQFTRAAVSITLNMAEGSADTDKQFNRYLQISLGSLNECVVCATIAKRLNYVSPDTNNEIREKLGELSKMITSLQKYIKNKTKY